jgi:hypothetical protein
MARTSPAISSIVIVAFTAVKDTRGFLVCSSSVSGCASASTTIRGGEDAFLSGVLAVFLGIAFWQYSQNTAFSWLFFLQYGQNIFFPKILWRFKGIKVTA